MNNLDIIIELLSYSGSSTNDPADSCKIKNRIQETEMLGFSRQQLVIADSTVDQSIALPDSNSEYLMILNDREISIKLNGGSEVITLSPRANGTKTFTFFKKGTITELSVSNSSGEAANIDIAIANK